MHIYWRTTSNKLACAEAADTEDHFEAILQVKEMLVSIGEGFNEPVLALIKGGKA
jgi:hypothetical protein